MVCTMLINWLKSNNYYHISFYSKCSCVRVCFYFIFVCRMFFWNYSWRFIIFSQMEWKNFWMSSLNWGWSSLRMILVRVFLVFLCEISFFIFCSGKKNNKILVTFSRFGLHFFPDLRPLILFWNMPTSNIFIDFVLFLFNIWHLTDILTKSLTFFKSWSK